MSYLPAEKQYLVTRGVPCRRRLDIFESAAGQGESEVAGGEGEEGWLRTGGGEGGHKEKGDDERSGEVRTLDGSGNLGEEEKEEVEDEIPDMEDEDDDDEAIIRENREGSGKSYVGCEAVVAA